MGIGQPASSLPLLLAGRLLSGFTSSIPHLTLIGQSLALCRPWAHLKLSSNLYMKMTPPLRFIMGTGDDDANGQEWGWE